MTIKLTTLTGWSAAIAFLSSIVFVVGIGNIIAGYIFFLSATVHFICYVVHKAPEDKKDGEQ